tara:strand:- start:261 stop:431 length:171 start_codon:yes stop_codon:yes gene_type:complete
VRCEEKIKNERKTRGRRKKKSTTIKERKLGEINWYILIVFECSEQTNKKNNSLSVP